MQLLLPLPGDIDDTTVAGAAARRGVNVSALAPHPLLPSPERGLLLGFGRLPEHRIPGAVRALAEVLPASAGGAATD